MNNDIANEDGVTGAAVKPPVELPPIGSRYLDCDSQLCVCLSYDLNFDFVIGEAIEHAQIDGRPNISISKYDEVSLNTDNSDKDLEAVTKIVYSVSHLPAEETGLAILSYINGDLGA